MSRIISPNGGLARQPRMEKMQVGGVEIPVCQDLDIAPGLAPESLINEQGALNLSAMCQFIGQLSGMLHAAMRECCALRERVEQLEGDVDPGDTGAGLCS
jgi:hypothetical protein